MIKRFNLSKNNQIVEIASNDGYLLKNFTNNQIPVLGIEPASNVAKTAEKEGIPTINEFFGSKETYHHFNVRYIQEPKIKDTRKFIYITD